jgi:amino acid transporter
MEALVPIDRIDMIGPVAQVLSAGAAPYGFAVQIVPAAIFGVMMLRIAQASVNFTGNTRLPMVTGWDRLLPQWFTRLDPKRRTPVNSILFVGIATLAMSLAGLVGVGHQEAFQFLWNSGAMFYAIPYAVMFAIPLLSRKLGPVPWWLRVAAFSGLAMTLLNIAFGALPIIDVKSSFWFTAKIGGLILTGNLAGAGIYWLRRSASKSPAS